MTRRYPLESLVTASGLTEAALARAVGLSGQTLKRARENGLREDAADRYAVRAGFAALEVWHDYGLVACAADDCGELFAAARRSHLYCSRRCHQRVYHRDRYRDRYRTDPDFAAAERDRSARYRVAAAPAVKFKKDAYYQANKDDWVRRRAARKAEVAA